MILSLLLQQKFGVVQTSQIPNNIAGNNFSYNQAPPIITNKDLLGCLSISLREIASKSVPCFRLISEVHWSVNKGTHFDNPYIPYRQYIQNNRYNRNVGGHLFVDINRYGSPWKEVDSVLEGTLSHRPLLNHSTPPSSRGSFCTAPVETLVLPIHKKSKKYLTSVGLKPYIKKEAVFMYAVWNCGK